VEARRIGNKYSSDHVSEFYGFLTVKVIFLNYNLHRARAYESVEQCDHNLYVFCLNFFI